MSEFIIKLLGYLLITTGIYIGYLSLFNSKMLPISLDKKLYRIIIVLVSITAIICGWLLVV